MKEFGNCLVLLYDFRFPVVARNKEFIGSWILHSLIRSLTQSFMRTYSHSPAKLFTQEATDARINQLINAVTYWLAQLVIQKLTL